MDVSSSASIERNPSNIEPCDGSFDEPFDEPAGARPLLRKIDIRRALLAVLVDTDRPLTIDEIVDRLEGDHEVMLAGRQAVSARQRVADMARYQARSGRARRVGRGRYIGVPEAMSRSMLWRCRNWSVLRDRFVRSRTMAPAAEPPSPPSRHRRTTGPLADDASDMRNVARHEALDDDQLLR